MEREKIIRKYIEENYRKEIYIGELALIAHLSPSYLSTKFKSPRFFFEG